MSATWRIFADWEPVTGMEHAGTNAAVRRLVADAKRSRPRGRARLAPGGYRHRGPLAGGKHGRGRRGRLLAGVAATAGGVLRRGRREPVIAIDGRCPGRFGAVREAFAENFEIRGEVGAVFAVTVNGELLIDLWGGYVDAARTRPWAEDTMVCMMSVAKAVTATCAAVLVDRGVLGWDAPVLPLLARVCAGRQAEPAPSISARPPCRAAGAGACAPRGRGVRLGVGHPGPRRPGTGLAARHPACVPLRYHGLSGGRGRAPGQRQVPRTLSRRGDLRSPSVSTTISAYPRRSMAAALSSSAILGEPLFDASRPDSLLARAMALVPADELNTSAFLAAEIPSINGVGTARGVARLFGALACGGGLDGVRLLHEETLREATCVQWEGEEELVGHTRAHGARLPARPSWSGGDGTEPRCLRAHWRGRCHWLRRPGSPGGLVLRTEPHVLGSRSQPAAAGFGPTPSTRGSIE